MQRTTTLKEVADACGVNIMTVARALRPGSSVAAETRAKVIEESRRLGYVPRPNFGRPRSLASITRPVVDVILGDHVASTFMHGLLDVICRELGRRSYDCLIRSAKGDFDDFLRLCESMRADRERTTMIVGYVPTSQLRVLLEVRPNALLVDHTGDPRVDVPCHSIGFDNAEAARQVVGHLATRGYRRILLINGIPGHYFTREVTPG